MRHVDDAHGPYGQFKAIVIGLQRNPGSGDDADDYDFGVIYLGTQTTVW